MIINICILAFIVSFPEGIPMNGQVNLFLRLSENWMICENNTKPWIRLSRIANSIDRKWKVDKSY